MTDPKPFDYSHLSVSERILLAQELWDSVYHSAAHEIPLTAAQTQEIHRRWEAHQAGEMTGSTWDEVKRRLLNR